MPDGSLWEGLQAPARAEPGLWEGLQAMRPVSRWPDQRGAYGVAGPDGPSNIETSGSRWPDIPLSSNIEDRRDNNEWFRGLMSKLGMSPPQIDQIKRAFTHPMTPLPHFTDTPILPQGPLSRQAGYDDIGR